MIANDEDIRKHLFRFILRKTPNLEAVNRYEMINTASEEGFCIMDYKVDCTVIERVESLSMWFLNNVTYRMEHKHKVCIVNSRAFRAWLEEELAIKWIK